MVTSSRWHVGDQGNRHILVRNGSCCIYPTAKIQWFDILIVGQILREATKNKINDTHNFKPWTTQACRTWQCTMCDFSRFPPARLDHRLVTKDLNGPFPEIVSHNCPCFSGMSAFTTSTRVILMLFLIMQSLPPRGTIATASIAREPPKWSLLSAERLQASLSLSYMRSLHPSRQSSAYRLPWSSTQGLRQPATIPLKIGDQLLVAGSYTSLITCRCVPRPLRNHLPQILTKFRCFHI